MTALPRSRRTTAALAALGLVATALAGTVVLGPGAAGDSATAFTRIDVDTAISGASFTSVGEVFAGEQDIVTSGYGTLDAAGRPAGGGTLQLYRPGADLTAWTKVTIFGSDEGIVFPNATTIADVDGDGDNDVIVPSGYFFGTDPAAASWLNTTGAVTWWENHGPGAPFEKHVVVSGQPGSYHGVQLVDLDGDEVPDLLSVSEEAAVAGELTDDEVETQFFKGLGGGAFAPPVALTTNLGGSQPVVHDIDGDGDLDIATSQYFHVINDLASSASFLWLENTHTSGPLTAADFTAHPIAPAADIGMGFQIRPVPDFRESGEVAWIGTNHVNRCTFTYLGVSDFAWPEQVIEFLPGSDLTEPWDRNALSDPASPPDPCPADYGDRAKYPVFSDAITSRYGPGQGAPGVFGYGDIDGDNDVDLAVSGDGDRRLWWIENLGGGETELHRLTDEGEYFGQAGGAVVADLDGNGNNELIFSSYDTNTLAIWTRGYTPAPTPTPSSTPTPTPSATPSPSTSPTPAPVRTVRSRLRLSPGKRAVAAGRRATWKVRLTAAPGGPRRTVSVVFDPARGRTVRIGTVRLTRTKADRVQRATVRYRARKRGRIVVTYAGAAVGPALRDTRARDAARVVIRR